MSQRKSTGVGPPRLDPVQRLLHRFYEPLILLRILNPNRKSTCMLLTPGQHSTTFTSLWADFLDDLSWFCDPHPGGDTVCSIAVEERPSGYHFWLASSYLPAQAHLQSVLCSLESIAGASAVDEAAAAQVLAQEAIHSSRRRVKKCCDRLRRAVNKEIELAQISAGTSPPAEALCQARTGSEDMLKAMREISDMRHGPLAPCEKACSFEYLSELSNLVRATTTVTEHSRWTGTRQPIARLRTWHSKAKRMVAFARSFPQFLSAATCELLPLPPGREMPAHDAKSNLMSMLGRMLPAHEQNKAKEIYDAMHDFRDLDWNAQFDEKIQDGNITLKVHAEVFLMEHFYFNKLKFVDNCRYIGCSKPSCYCCSLYMRYHPGNFVVRPSHGTLWPSWSPPLMSRSEDEVIRRHNLGIMNDVIKHLRRDILIDVDNRISRSQRLPDSTSGAMASTI